MDDIAESELLLYVPASDDRLGAEHALIAELVRDLWRAKWPGYRSFTLKQFPAGERIAAADKKQGVRLVRAALAWREHARRADAAIRHAGGADAGLVFDFHAWDVISFTRVAVEGIFEQLLRRNLPYEAADVLAIIRSGTGDGAALVKALGFYANAEGGAGRLTGEVAAAVRKQADELEKTGHPKAARSVRALRALLGAEVEPAPEPPAPARLPTPGPARAGSPLIMIGMKKALGLSEAVPEAEATRLAPDDFPLRSDSPLAREHALLVPLYEDVIRTHRQLLDELQLNESALGRQILALPGAMRGRVLWAAAERAQTAFSPRQMQVPAGESYQTELARGAMVQVALALMGPDLELQREGLFDLLLWCSAPTWEMRRSDDISGALLSRVPREGLTEGERYVLHRLRVLTVHALPLGVAPPEAAALSELIGDLPMWALIPGDAWADAFNAVIAAATPARRRGWFDLAALASTATASRPSAKWLAQAAGLVKAIGAGEVRAALMKCLALLPAGRSVPADATAGARMAMNAENETVLRGLLWVAPLVADEGLARAIGAGAVSLYKKIPGKGPRAVKGGNAAIYALSEMREPAALGQLALLKVKVRFGTAQKEIEKAFTAAAAKAKLPREEIEELAVPTYGLEEVGELRETLGEYTAVLTARGVHDVGLTFFTAEGKALKSVPAAVKKEFKEELKELQDSVKDIAQMLPAQAERLDSLYLQERSWALPVWRERYLDHPLMGVLARRLIWAFASGGETRAGIWRDGGLVDSGGKALPALEEGTRVSLLHPIGAGVEEITAWRRLMEGGEIVQPFKQAHREIYLLTDAERTTRTYSNRYGAHIVRQHQFSALCAARGWRHKLRLMVDDTYPPPSRELALQKLRAELWVEPVGENYGTDTSEAGVFLRLSTDQVRFYPIDAGANSIHAGGGGYSAGYGIQAPAEPLALETIPPLVFSEIMRDVDLFVGVSSVGNDATWNDGGPQGRHRAYWQAYSFGDLNATAATRRAVLERLVPRLKIAARAHLSDRFLVIRGDIRTYHIHLGSGNILMEPDNQYLCIVANQSEAAGGQGIHLPFEGDRTLSIILSKAFLLANDRGIKDASIVSQIKRQG